MTRITIVLLAACSSKAEAPPPSPAPVAIDAPPPIDAAPPPFAVDDKGSTFGDAVEIHPHGKPCPMLEWRPQPKSVLVRKCKDQPFAAQIDTLRDMATFLRGRDRRFDEARIVGGVDFYSWPELGRRFIAYAKTHPWNQKTQSLNAYVIEAGSKGDMFPEYAAIFQRKPKLTSAEKCSAGRANRKGEVGEFLRKEGVTGTAEIPLGCAMGFIELEQP